MPKAFNTTKHYLGTRPNVLHCPSAAGHCKNYLLTRNIIQPQFLYNYQFIIENSIVDFNCGHPGRIAITYFVFGSRPVILISRFISFAGPMYPFNPESQAGFAAFIRPSTVIFLLVSSRFWCLKIGYHKVSVFHIILLSIFKSSIGLLCLIDSQFPTEFPAFRRVLAITILESWILQVSFPILAINTNILFHSTNFAF